MLVIKSRPSPGPVGFVKYHDDDRKDYGIKVRIRDLGSKKGPIIITRTLLVHYSMNKRSPKPERRLKGEES